MDHKWWKILKEMGIPDHLTCLQRKLYVGQEATVRTGHLSGSVLGNENDKAVYCHPAYLTSVWSTSCKMKAGLNESQTRIWIARRNINKLRYADDTESEEELKNLLMMVKDKSEKADLNLNIQKTKFMASSPITSWQIEREKVETVTDFICLGYQTIADGYCSPEIERCLLFGREALTDLDSIFKSRDIILLTKVHIIKDMVFPVVMYGNITTDKPRGGDGIPAELFM